MKKYAYLAKLEALLANLPEQERDDALAYYEEYIDAAGKDKEEQTIAALGSPEEVAQKILEGEGLTDTAADAAAESAAGSGIPAAPQAAEAAAPAAKTGAPLAPPAAAASTASTGTPAAPTDAPTAPPKGPEPPPVFDAAEPAPASYTPGMQSAAAGFHPFRNPPRPFSRRGWIIFVCVIAAALIVQLAVLALHFGDRSSRTARDEVAVAVPGVDSGYATDRVSETAPGTAQEEADVTDTAGDYGAAEHNGHDGNGTDHGTAVAADPPTNADGIVSIYDDQVQEVELHITSANLYISHDNSEQVHLEISGLDADKFETTYQYDDARRKMVVRDRRNVSANTPAEETTVTLTLPQGFHDVEAKLVTGNITLDELIIDEAELETGTGDIEAVSFTVGKLDLKTSTGNITVGPVTPGAGEHEVDLKTGTGNIDAVLGAAQADYEYEIKAQHGSVVLNNAAMGGSAQSRSGRYELEASAYTGDISVTFAG